MFRRSDILHHLLKPLARLAIAKGVRFADMAEQMKRAYVDVAHDLAKPKAPVSRISVMTGLQRRDIARLLAEPEPPMQRPDALSKLVALWLARFEAKPRPRPVRAFLRCRFVLSFPKGTFFWFNL